MERRETINWRRQAEAVDEMAAKGDGNGLKRFLKRVKLEFRPERVLLFGSRARGDYLKGSDYDLLVISEAFRSYNFRERIIKIYGLLSEPAPYHIICLTPEEFERKRNEIGVIRIAAREGIEVS